MNFEAISAILLPFLGTTIGSGNVVYSQSIEVGTVVAKGTIVEIEMRYMQMG